MFYWIDSNFRLQYEDMVFKLIMLLDHDRIQISKYMIVCFMQTKPQAGRESYIFENNQINLFA